MQDLRLLYGVNSFSLGSKNAPHGAFFIVYAQADRYTLNLDYATTGVGCTCVYVLDGYRVKPSAYDRVITIKPVR